MAILSSLTKLILVPELRTPPPPFFFQHTINDKCNHFQMEHSTIKIWTLIKTFSCKPQLNQDFPAQTLKRK